jgi:hypothetical protein
MSGAARRALFVNLDFADFVYGHFFGEALSAASRERGLELDRLSVDPLAGRDLGWELGIEVRRDESSLYFATYDEARILSAIDDLAERHSYDAMFINCRAPLFAALLRRPTFAALPWIVYDRHLHEEASLLRDDATLEATLRARNIHMFMLEGIHLGTGLQSLPVKRASLVPWPMDDVFFAPGLRPRRARPVIFAGGDSGRDYACLVEATADLDVDIRIASSWRPPERPAHFDFLPRLPLHQFRNEMRAADLVAIPLSGGLLRTSGITVLEMAMFVGTPAVVSDGRVTRQIVAHDETAWLVAPGDSRALREGIAAVFADPARAERIALRAREVAVDKYRLRRFVDQMLDALAEPSG